MWISKKRYRELIKHCKDSNERLDSYYIAYDKRARSIERIRKSNVVFEKTEGIENLYIADELDTKCQLVIYSSKTAIEKSVTEYFSRHEATHIPGLEVVGFLEMELWHKESGYIHVSKLFVDSKYRRKGYATKILERLIECAKFHNAKKIVLTASAGDGIKQSDLEKLYQKCGFTKVSENDRRMICEL